MHQRPAKLAEDEITTYTTLQLVQENIPSFTNFAIFLALTIIFVYYLHIYSLLFLFERPFPTF